MWKAGDGDGDGELMRELGREESNIGGSRSESPGVGASPRTNARCFLRSS